MSSGEVACGFGPSFLGYGSSLVCRHHVDCGDVITRTAYSAAAWARPGQYALLICSRRIGGEHVNRQLLTADAQVCGPLRIRLSAGAESKSTFRFSNPDGASSSRAPGFQILPSNDTRVKQWHATSHWDQVKLTFWLLSLFVEPSRQLYTIKKVLVTSVVHVFNTSSQIICLVYTLLYSESSGGAILPYIRKIVI